MFYEPSFFCMFVFENLFQVVGLLRNYANR